MTSIDRDEKTHIEYSLELYRRQMDRPSPDEVSKIIEEALNMCLNFADEILPENQDVKEYSRQIAKELKEKL